MKSSLLSPADDIAISHWGSIKAIVTSNPEDFLMEQQMIFAKAIWLKAFEAGHAKGLEALSTQSGCVSPHELMESLNSALVDRRSAFLIVQATDLIQKMFSMLREEDREKLAGTSKAIPHQRQRPELRVVRSGKESV